MTRFDREVNALIKNWKKRFHLGGWLIVWGWKTKAEITAEMGFESVAYVDPDPSTAFAQVFIAKDEEWADHQLPNATSLDFVIGHEVAHVALADRGIDKRIKDMVNLGMELGKENPLAKRQVENWNHELSESLADMLAALLLEAKH